MTKSDTLQGSLDLLVLKILSRRAPLHGYAIMMAVEEISGEVLRVEEGSLYPALHRMEEAGSIRATWLGTIAAAYEGFAARGPRTADREKKSSSSSNTPRNITR